MKETNDGNKWQKQMTEARRTGSVKMKQEKKKAGSQGVAKRREEEKSEQWRNKRTKKKEIKEKCSVQRFPGLQFPSFFLSREPKIQPVKANVKILKS